MVLHVFSKHKPMKNSAGAPGILARSIQGSLKFQLELPIVREMNHMAGSQEIDIWARLRNTQKARPSSIFDGRLREVRFHRWHFCIRYGRA
jgi:hypothetical protein